MIQKEPDRKYHVFCDYCGREPDREEDGYDEFYEAVEAVRINGWHSKKQNELWINICPECFYK